MEDTARKKERKDKQQPGGGIDFQKGSGEIRPPLEKEGEEGERPAGLGPLEEAQPEELRRVKPGKVPLHPAVIVGPAIVLANVAAALTGWDGWALSEDEKEILKEVWANTGIEMPPTLQAAIATTAMMAGKAGGYAAWRATGRKAVAEAEPK